MATLAASGNPNVMDLPYGCPFTVGELVCVQLLADGLTLEDIAAARRSSPSTIRTQLKTAREKMGVQPPAGLGGARRARDELLDSVEQAGWIGRDLAVDDVQAIRLQRFRERRSATRARSAAAPARGQRMPGATLSTRELGVMRLLAGGMTRSGVAVKLGMKPGSMPVLLQNVFDELEAHSIVEAIATCRARGLLEPLASEPDPHVVRFRMAENCPLSPRQLQVLAQAANGLTPPESAKQLGMSAHSVNNSLSGAYHRLGVKTVGQALAACYARGWLDTDLGRGERSRQEETVTWTQRLYLEAWDQGRNARDDDACARWERMRDDSLEGIACEANVELPDRPKPADPLLDRLLPDLAAAGTAQIDGWRERVFASAQSKRTSRPALLR